MQRSTWNEAIFWEIFRRIGLFFVVFFVGIFVSSAQLRIEGRVLDAQNWSPIHGATINVVGAGSSGSTATDQAGGFSISIASIDRENASNVIDLRITALGYEAQRVSWALNSDSLLVELEPSNESIDEVIVSGKTRYSRRNNPAVELMNKVHENRNRNRMSTFSHVEYDSYEKIMIGLTDLPRLISNNPIFKSYRFVFENVDTTLVPGSELVPIYLEEKVSTEYRRFGVAPARKSLVRGVKKTELDERFVNNDNIQSVVSHLHTDIDLYENNIILLNRSFLSPVGTGATLVYKYAIRDTLQLDDGAYISVQFAPINSEDRLFTGNLLISTDGSYAVRQAELSMGERANINWINNLHIHLDFSRDRSGHYFPSKMETKINFGLYGSNQGMFSHWITQQDKHQWDSPEAARFTGAPVTTLVGSSTMSSEFWEEERPEPLSITETTTYQNIDSLQKNAGFLRTLRWIKFLTTSYTHIGPVELGPLEYAYSFNSLEGNRLRLGGRTTGQISDRLYGEAYAAYGFKDDRWKYYAAGAISLNDRRVAEFPAHYLHFTYQQDAGEPGQKLDFLNGDSFFRSFRQSNQNKWMYNEIFRGHHVFEFGNHIRVQSSLSLHRQEPAMDLVYQEVGSDHIIPSIRTTEASVELRWAPYEEYYQRHLVRSPIVNRHPVFNLRYNVGMNGVLGGQYDYQALRFDASKRWYFSILGYSDVTLGTGYIFGSVPFPLLDVPMTNSSYLLREDSFSLMNELEFVSDQYVKFFLDHRFEGLLTNRIPLLKKLKLREMVGFKMFWGGLRGENNPEMNPSLFRFPEGNDGQTTFPFKRKPYLEASIGVENILNVLRIEYVKRLSYLDHPGAKPDGIRLGIRWGF